MSHSHSHPHPPSHPHHPPPCSAAHPGHSHAQVEAREGALEGAQDHAHDACCSPVPVAVAPPQPVAADALLLRIPAMDCPAEEAQIRRALHGIEGVRSLRFDLPARTLALDAAAHAHGAVHAALHGAGFESERLSSPPAAQDVTRARRLAQWKLGAALLVALAAELLHGLAPESRLWQLAGMALAAVAIGLSGTAVFAKGLQALLRGQLNINALMSVAVAGAFAIGQWPEAAMVMALYALAELIEARSVERARHAIAGLLALAPPEAEVRQPDGSWAVREARGIAPGAIARVRPGERFPLDGRVTAGRGAVDQSPVTGESLPVDKGVGDPVYAGTINQEGALEFEVTRAAGDTLLARILHAVEQAQSQRAPTQRFVDRFAAVYTPAVFALALAVALGAPLLLGWPWLAALYKALVLLVIACPCALVISTPVTVVSGLAAAARRGILIKGGVYLEEARRLSVVALDKTGTLTEGRPRCVAQQVLATTADEALVLRIAAGLAARSDHPVAKAVAAALGPPAVAVQDFAAEAGRGVRGRIEGREYVLGNHRWIHERGQCDPGLEALLAGHEAQGRTLSLLADGERVLALFAVADSLRETSRQAVSELHALGVRTVMLTGDNAATARAIAAQVGIDEVRSLLLPDDKRQAVAALGATQRVAMVGDGINDAPSLAAASIGFSMGAAGTDTAKEAADVLIMDDDLRKLPETIRLSRRTSAVLWQNIALALGIKAVFFVLAMRGDASMWMAVFADMGASLLVVFNGLRLLRGAPGRSHRERPE